MLALFSMLHPTNYAKNYVGIMGTGLSLGLFRKSFFGKIANIWASTSLSIRLRGRACTVVRKPLQTYLCLVIWCMLLRDYHEKKLAETLDLLIAQNQSCNFYQGWVNLQISVVSDSIDFLPPKGTPTNDTRKHSLEWCWATREYRDQWETLFLLDLFQM